MSGLRGKTQFRRFDEAGKRPASREGSTNTIRVTWSPVSFAQTYSIYRQSLHGRFQWIGDSATTQYLDAGPLAQNVTYVYYVIASGSGHGNSPPSNRDLATLMTFTSVSAGMVVDDAHFNELLAGLNALRVANGWSSPVSWSQLLPPNSPPPAAGNPITVGQLVTLRQRFDEAMSGLGVAVRVYSDAIVTANATTVRAAHITDLQERIK